MELKLVSGRCSSRTHDGTWLISVAPYVDVAACTKEQLSLLARLVAEVEHITVGEEVTVTEIAWVSKLLSTLHSIHESQGSR